MAQKATDEQVESHVERTGGDLPPGVESSREEDAGLSDLTPEGTEITMRGEKFYIQEMLAGQLLGISADIGEFGLSFQGIRADDAPLILAIITSRMDIVLKIAATMLEKDIAFVERGLLERKRKFFSPTLEPTPGDLSQSDGSGQGGRRTDGDEARRRNAALRKRALDRNAADWFDLVNDLTNNGHYWPGMREGLTGIKGYTLTQFERFCEALERRRSRERADRIEETGYAARTVFAKIDVLQGLVKGFRENAGKRRTNRKGRRRNKRKGRG
jgi:hypothetical protein